MSDSKLPLGLAVGATGAGLVGLVGYLLGRGRGSQETLKAYQNMVKFGRPDTPKVAVREAPPGPEERITAAISETALTNLADHLSKEAGVSSRRAREEAERLMSQFETTGLPEMLMLTGLERRHSRSATTMNAANAR